MRSEFCLILNHMHSQIMSYQSALIKCQSRISGETLAEHVSVLRVAELQEAAPMQDSGEHVHGRAGEFLKVVSTSCKPVGHSTEAAACNRKQYFAFMDHFGCSAFFLTINPCDECTFRVRLFVDADKVHTLPSLENITSPEKLSNCMLDLNLRKTQRLQHPGACSLVYQHLMQIVIECLFGWSKKT
jgi:hypothetical protein